jgi:hypothetical protein
MMRNLHTLRVKIAFKAHIQAALRSVDSTGTIGTGVDEAGAGAD